MDTLQTRRTIMKLAGAAGFAIESERPTMSAGAQPDIDSGGIGLPKSEWEAIVGEGTPAGNVVQYANPELDGMTILAQFGADDQVTHLEFGYEEAPDGGLPEDEVRAQITGALPSDATLEESFAITQLDRERTQYRIERYLSESLRGTSSGLAPVLIAWQSTEVGFGTPDGPRSVVMRVTLATPGAHTLELREVGNPGGIGLSREEWTAHYGAPEPAQGGDLFENQVVPDLQLLVQFAPGDRASLIDTVALEMMPIVEWSQAKQLVGSLLPEDAVMQETSQMPPTPQGLAALSIEMWECPSLAGEGNETGSVLAFYEQAIDTNPVTAARVAVALPLPAKKATPEA